MNEEKSARLELFAATEGGSSFWGSEITQQGAHQTLLRIKDGFYRSSKAEKTLAQLNPGGAAALLESIEGAGGVFITPSDASWPQQLDDLATPPIGLVVKGKVDSLKTRSIAIVGTRNPTSYGARIAGDFAAGFMAILIMVSTFGCNNGLILSGARVYYAMAEDGLFFKRAAQLNKNSVPYFSLMIQAVWASVLCLSGSYGDLLDYATFASLIFYIITIAGIFKLRIKEPKAERPYKVIAYPFTPALYILLATTICVILLITKTQNTLLGLLIVSLGIPVFFIRNYYAKKNNAA